MQRKNEEAKTLRSGDVYIIKLPLFQVRMQRLFIFRKANFVSNVRGISVPKSHSLRLKRTPSVRTRPPINQAVFSYPLTRFPPVYARFILIEK